MNENKTQPTKASVNKFIAAVENDRRRQDAKTALKIYKEVTGLKPVMWGPSIIGFGSYHYVTKSGRAGDWPMAGFSPRKASMSFYISGQFPEAPELFAKLGKYKRAVGCLYINKLDDVDLDVLRELISRDYEEACKRGSDVKAC